MARTILVIDDEDNMRWVLDRSLQKAGYDVVAASRGDEGLRLFARHAVDLVLLDLKMPGMDGLTVLRTLRERGSQVPVLLLTAFATIPTAIEAIKIGATDYVRKPFDLEDLQTKISYALHAADKSSNTRNSVVFYNENNPAGNLPGQTPESLIGISPIVSRVQTLVEAAATNDYTVLVTGEVGSCRGALAHYLHLRKSSSARSAPGNGLLTNNLIVINCDALPNPIIEKELGSLLHEEPDESDLPPIATPEKHPEKAPERWEHALGGTLLITHIDRLRPKWVDCLSRNIQPYLRSIQRPHGLRLILTLSVAESADTETVPSTEEPAEPGGRWEALFPHAITIHLPPLRERPEDLPFLLAHTEPDLMWRREAIEALAAYDWPRNVAELKQTIAYASTIANGCPIGRKHLPPTLLPASQPEAELSTESQPAIPFVLPEAGINLDEVEQNLIEQALERTAGNKAQAARLLGISRSTLLYRLEKYGLGIGAAAKDTDE